jgi:hypothetical protein
VTWINAQLGHVAQHLAVLLEVLVPTVQAQLDAAHVELVAFQPVQLETGLGQPRRDRA